MEPVEGLAAKRSYHTATVIEYNKKMWVVIVGGISEWMSSNKARQQKILSDTSILQLTFGMAIQHKNISSLLNVSNR